MLALEGRAIEPRQGHSAGRQLLQQMVTRLTGAPMPAIGIAAKGKPYFIDNDLHLYRKVQIFLRFDALHKSEQVI